MFNTTQSDLQPYMNTGNNALTSLQSFNNGPGQQQYPGFSFNYNPASDPEYNFLLQQGGNAITSQASALGGVNSGATLKALSDYGQQTALGSYQSEFNNSLNSYNTNFNTWNSNLNNIFSRLYNTASLGENAAAGVGNAAIQTGQSIGNNIIGAGNAQAAGTVGSANALSGGLVGGASSLTSLLSNQAFLNSFNGGGGGGNYSPYNTPAMSNEPALQ
ncbi:hypothetical protein ACFSHT_22475 [Paraburkholderia silviterrae]|uniref:DNA transfer protein p32 n=1 Tax=Paraburkholderia silviterrae TaxID=2528715 RepID=A0A4R5MF38_9BURK|nr:DNA transfer protein p32 [Paraburkholderia silviterrae]TDG25853.1 DNA transfer protein p32 [Paraburkholderia silviterrae]